MAETKTAAPSIPEGPRQGNEKPAASGREDGSGGQRSLLEKRISGKNRDKRIEAALLFISGFLTSPTRLAEKFGVTKNSVLRWKKKDGWVELAQQTDQLTRASLPATVASWKAKRILSLEEDLELIDRKKEKVAPKSLEGLLKAKAALQEQLSRLMGVGVAEEPKVTIIFGGYGPPPEPRGPVQVPGKIAVADDGTPRSGALADVENTEDTEGGIKTGEGGKGGLIENRRGNAENDDSEEKAGEKEQVSERTEARGGRKLSGGKTKITEGLTLEEVVS